MKTIPAAARSRSCMALVTLAAFEAAAGHSLTARDSLAAVTACARTGVCPCPALCFPPPRPASAPAGHAVLARCARSGGAASGPGIVVPFPADARWTTVTDEAGNRVAAQGVSLDVLRADGGGLGQLLRYWEGLRRYGPARMSELDPVQFLRMGLFGKIHLVHAASPDRERYAIEIRGFHIPPSDPTQGRPLLQHAVRVFGEYVTRSIAAARETGAAAYGRLDAELLGRRYKARRLVLPLSSDGLRHDRVLVALELDQSPPLVETRVGARSQS